MVIVRPARRQEVAIRIDARQALGGGIILHQVGIRQDRQSDIAVQSQLGLEAHHFPDRGHDTPFVPDR